MCVVLPCLRVPFPRAMCEAAVDCFSWVSVEIDEKTEIKREWRKIFGLHSQPNDGVVVYHVVNELINLA